MRRVCAIAAVLSAAPPVWAQDGLPSGLSGWVLYPPVSAGMTFYDPSAMDPEELRKARNASCQYIARYAEEQMVKAISGFDIEVTLSLKGNSENTEGVACTLTSKRSSEFAFSGEIAQ